MPIAMVGIILRKLRSSWEDDHVLGWPGLKLAHTPEQECMSSGMHRWIAFVTLRCCVGRRVLGTRVTPSCQAARNKHMDDVCVLVEDRGVLWYDSLEWSRAICQ